MGRKKEIPKKQNPNKLKLKSKYEKKVAQFLADNNVPFLYEKTRIDYTVPASKHRYMPDFELPGGIFVESKGIFDRLARQKMALVMEQNPDKDIRLLFMRNNKINKNAKMTYGDWCDKRGIKWAVSAAGVVPEDWINEALNRGSSDT